MDINEWIIEKLNELKEFCVADTGKVVIVKVNIDSHMDVNDLHMVLDKYETYLNEVPDPDRIFKVLPIFIDPERDRIVGDVEILR